MRTRRQYMIDTLGGGRIDVAGDADAAGIVIELRHGQPTATLNIEQAQALIVALGKAIDEAERPLGEA